MSSSQQLLLGEGAGGGGYQISRSLRFNSADSAYLNRTPASNGSSTTWTWSAWVKRGTLGVGGGVFYAGVFSTSNDNTGLQFRSDDTLQIFQNNGATTVLNKITTQVFRDPSAWYHIVLTFDTTNATAEDRVRIYVNGVRVTAFSTNTNISQNGTTYVNSTSYGNRIFRDYTTTYLDGYLTEINFIDGQALTPSSFGQTNASTGVWEPIAYTGTYGTNGFYVNFSDNSGTTSTTLGKDYSGNGNNWTPNNFSVTAGVGNDSMVDSPTSYGTDTGAGGEVRGNYATLNPLALGSSASLANGNLDISYGSTTPITATMATMGMSSGKWYWEATFTASSVSPNQALIGITNTSVSAEAGGYPGNNATGWGYYGNTGQKFTNGTGSAYGATFTTNDVIGFAFDADAGSITAYKNGVSQGVMFSSLAVGTYFPAIGDGSGAPTFSASFNFGQRPFAYTAPSGYKALCTQNLPAPTISNGALYMAATTYTGNGTYPTTITNGGNNPLGTTFQPDLVWVKVRSNTYDHILYDSVRGTGTGASLVSNSTSAEGANSAYANLTAFASNGFTVGSVTAATNVLNQSSQTFVAWQWQAGQGTTSSNTSGSITSTVSVNATAGFSVVTYTGTLSGTPGVGAMPTVGHGLGATPSLIISKSRNVTGVDSGAWFVWISATATDNYLRLNTTAGTASVSGGGGGTMVAPTNSVFSTPYISGTNINANNYVAYCFAPIAGYSAFGSYTGNGSTDGPFVFTNHRPAFLLIKRTDTTSNWTILDLAREGYNVDNDPLYPNLSNAEGTTDLADILSNGFKLRSTDASVNANTGTYIYMSLASNPFKYSLAR